MVNVALRARRFPRTEASPRMSLIHSGGVEMRIVGPCSFLVLLLAGHLSLGADLVGSLKALREVGPQGAGQAAAAEAWLALSQADAEQLPEIIAALDVAGPLAINWIRAAADAVGERQLRSSTR